MGSGSSKQNKQNKKYVSKKHDKMNVIETDVDKGLTKTKNINLRNNAKKENEKQRQSMNTDGVNIASGKTDEGGYNTIKEYSEKLRHDVAVSHYMPPTFAIIDFVTEEDLIICSNSWDWIIQKGQNNNQRIVTFTDEFYYRLFKKHKKLGNIFNSFHDKAGVLLKAATFLLQNHRYGEVANLKFAELGRMHRKMNLSGWMFSAYITNFLEIIEYILCEQADERTMEAWVRVSAYGVRKLLQNFVVLKETSVLEYAVNVNSKLQTLFKEREEEERAKNVSFRISEKASSAAANDYDDIPDSASSFNAQAKNNQKIKKVPVDRKSIMKTHSIAEEE